jgi:hypothetical protein
MCSRKIYLYIYISNKKQSGREHNLVHDNKIYQVKMESEFPSSTKLFSPSSLHVWQTGCGLLPLSRFKTDASQTKIKK